MPPQETSIPPNVQPRSHTKLIAIVGILVLLLLAVGAVQYYFTSQSVSQQTHEDFYTSLGEMNPSFAEAERLAKQSDFAGAIPHYQAALSAARSDEERIQIKLLMARTMISAGSYVEAVPLFKEIIASNADPRTMRPRSLAFSDLAELYSRGDVATNMEIFKDEPFKTLWAGANVRLTLRRMYEYAASIYPTALSQLHVAQWYTAQLLNAEANGISNITIQEYIAAVKQLVESADKDIADLETEVAMKRDYHAALLERAIVIGDMQRYGDMSLGDANASYGRAIDALSTEGSGQDGIARYYYALFIARTYGAEKKEDIRTILAPLATPGYAEAPIIELLKNARAVPFHRQFPKQLAAIDPDFKSFLMSIGWTMQDLQ